MFKKRKGSLHLLIGARLFWGRYIRNLKGEQWSIFWDHLSLESCKCSIFQGGRREGGEEKKSKKMKEKQDV